MSHSHQPSQRVTQRQEVRVDPSVVLRGKLLSLNHHELEQAIESELNENPALERLEHDVEPITDQDVMRSVAPYELKQSSEDSERQRCTSPDDLMPDWTELAQAPPSLTEHVRAQLLNRLHPEMERIANYLVDSINDRGYLDTSLEDLSLALNVPLEDVEAMHYKLMQCEPKGIGARNVVECLLAQLTDALSLEERLAREILEHHLDDLIARRATKLSKKFKVMPAIIEMAFTEILTLDPNPADGFSTTPTLAGASQSISVTPDLMLRRTETGWEVEPKGGDPTTLCVSSSYRAQIEKLKAKGGEAAAEREHLSAYAQRADQFIHGLRDRRRMMRLIGAYLVERQGSFISTGQYEFLVPLTRAQLSQELGVHESTVSRATMGKFVQIDNGEVVAFDVFFKPALRLQKMIEEILQNENPNDPMSDEMIAKALEAKGVFVARRTVNKYRDKRRLLSSRARKTA